MGALWKISETTKKLYNSYTYILSKVQLALVISLSSVYWAQRTTPTHRTWLARVSERELKSTWKQVVSHVDKSHDNHMILVYLSMADSVPESWTLGVHQEIQKHLLGE